MSSNVIDALAALYFPNYFVELLWDSVIAQFAVIGHLQSDGKGSQLQ